MGHEVLGGIYDECPGAIQESVSNNEYSLDEHISALNRVGFRPW